MRYSNYKHTDEDFEIPKENQSSEFSYSQLLTRKFDGINVSSSALAISNNSAKSAYNVRLDNQYGTLNNDIGIEKYNSYGTSNPIVALAQLKKHGYVNIDQSLFSLSNSTWWLGDWNYWDFWATYGNSDIGFLANSYYNGLYYKDNFSNNFENTQYLAFNHGYRTCNWGKINNTNGKILLSLNTYAGAPYYDQYYLNCYNSDYNLSDSIMIRNGTQYMSYFGEYDSTYNKFITFDYYGYPVGGGIRVNYEYTYSTKYISSDGVIANSFWDNSTRKLYLITTPYIDYSVNKCGVIKLSVASNGDMTVDSKLIGTPGVYFQIPTAIHAYGDYIYISDRYTKQIIKCKMDNSNRVSYSTGSYEPYSVMYDEITGFISYGVSGSNNIYRFNESLFT